MPPDGDYTTEELSELIRDLSEADIHRLEGGARLLALKCRRDPRELVSEAVERCLDGRRNCPRRMGVVAFLYGAMKSIASEWSDKLAIGRGRVDENHWGKRPEVEVEALVDERPSAESLLLEMERLRWEEAIIEEVRTRFENDEQAWYLIEADIEGTMSVEEICASVGIDRKGYEALRKRVRRGLNEIRDRHSGA